MSYTGPRNEFVDTRGFRAENVEGVLTVAFDRPDQRNAIDVDTSLDIARLLVAVAEDAAVRVVVLRGAGAGFSAGMDVADFADTASRLEPDLRAARESANHWRTCRLRQLPQPVIAMVHGFCEAGAITVVEGCDIAFAAEDTVFTAADGHSFDGREAERNGVVTLAFPADVIEAETHALARDLVAKDALALQFTKATLRHVASMSWDGVLDYNAAKQAEFKSLQAGRPSTRAAAVESFLAGKSKPGLGG